MKREIDKARLEAVAVWGLLGLFLALYFFKVDVNYGDDAHFAMVLESQSLWEWTVERYQTWSSRNLIDALMVILRVYAPGLWRVLNTAVYVLLGYLISWLFTDRSLAGNCVIAGSIMMLFGWDLHDAGFIASSLNYSWPGMCALLAMVPVKKALTNQELHVPDGLLLLPAVLAANEELTAVLVTGTAVTAIVLCIWQKRRIVPCLWAEAAIGALGLIYILTCPGNRLRVIREAEVYYPEFPQLDFWDKLQNGFNIACYSMLRKGNYLYILLGVMMTVLVIAGTRKMIKWIPALLLTAFLTCLGTLRPRLARVLPILEPDESTSKLFTDPGITAGAETLLFLILLLLLFGVLYQACADWRQFAPAAYMLLFGLASKTVMGFSPTVLASGSRTCFFLLMSIIIVTAIAADISVRKLSRKAVICEAGVYLALGIYIFGGQMVNVWR